MPGSQKHPTLLIILDGYGYSKDTHYNAIANANAPHLHAWFREYPHALLAASGAAVGLLPGTIGTSEVGHLTIGAGRVIPESVQRIQQEIESGAFFTNPTLVQNLDALKNSGGRLHLMGLLSDAGVHSHINHLKALIKAGIDHGIEHIYVHAFLDGRDVPPRSALTYINQLNRVCAQNVCVSVASIHGRFFAMDRDKNWQRTEESYRVLTATHQRTVLDYEAEVKHFYELHIYDEFIPPFLVDPNGIIRDGDGVIFYNFRADRARQLTMCFVCPGKVPFSPQPPQLKFFIGMTDYDHDCPNVHLIEKKPVKHTLKEVLSDAGKTIFSIAETEKYAHVTYFFSGGREKEFPGETWHLIPSIKTKDYIHHPEMSAPQITDEALKSLHTKPADFYLINYANADMVGHSGNYDATIKAVEWLDVELKRLYDVVIPMGGTMYITADHGNAELMFDEKNDQPKTSHTTNPVPFIMIKKGLKDGEQMLPLKELSDIAPFILHNMDLQVPKEMER